MIFEIGPKTIAAASQSIEGNFNLIFQLSCVSGAGLDSRIRNRFSKRCGDAERVAEAAVNSFDFNVELSEAPLAVQAKRVNRLGDGKKMRCVPAMITGNGYFARQRGTGSHSPAKCLGVLRAINSSRLQANLGFHFLLASTGGSRLRHIFQVKVERAAAQDVGLVAHFRLPANGERSCQPGARFAPCGLHRDHRSVAIDQRAPGQIPVVIVVVDIEPAKRRQHDTGADGLIRAELVLHPKLLNTDFSTTVPFNFLRKLHASGFARRSLIHFNFQQAFKFGLAVHANPVAQLGIRRQNEAPEREPLCRTTRDKLPIGNIIGFEAE